MLMQKVLADAEAGSRLDVAHLVAHGLDLAGEQVHRHGGSDLLVRLDVPDDVEDGVEAVLDGEGEAVVHGADEVGDLLSGLEVGGARDADAEGVQGAAAVAVGLLAHVPAAREGVDGFHQETYCRSGSKLHCF